MSRYCGPITKLSRRLGVMLFTNGESKRKAYSRKNYKPGEHGNKRFSQTSEYGKRLLEKQKARFLYGITEKQSRKYYDMANKSEEITGVKYMKILETRLDNVLYRAGLANSRPQARQIVSHGLMNLNGKRVTVPSILVKVGDKFEVRENKKDSNLFENAKAGKVKAPKWIKFDIKKMGGEVAFMPEDDDIEQIVENQLITEFYSK